MKTTTFSVKTLRSVVVRIACLTQNCDAFFSTTNSFSFEVRVRRGYVYHCGYCVFQMREGVRGRPNKFANYIFYNDVSMYVYSVAGKFGI